MSSFDKLETKAFIILWIEVENRKQLLYLKHITFNLTIFSSGIIL